MSGAFSLDRAGIARQPLERLRRLDALRGLAACGVAFLYHTRNVIADGTLAILPLPLSWFRDWGWTLVDLFFLISGYIFAHVYLRGDGLRREDLGDFAVARVARLYPLHLLTLCACALLFADRNNTVPGFLANLTMLQAFYHPQSIQPFNGPSWSISIECLCYVLFALAAVSGKRCLRLVSVLAIGGAVLYFALLGKPGGPWNADDIPRGLLGFFLGQMMWQLRAPLSRLPRWLLAGVLLAGLTIDPGGASSLLPICLLAWPALLLLVLRMPAMEARPLRWLGDRSYAIYLIHFPVLRLFDRWFGTVEGGVGQAALAVLAIAVTVLLLSDLSFRFLERPARRAIRAAWSRRVPALAQPA